MAVGRGGAALEAEAATCGRAKRRRCWAAWRLPPWCPDLVQPRDPLLASCSRIAMERWRSASPASARPESCQSLPRGATHCTTHRVRVPASGVPPARVLCDVPCGAPQVAARAERRRSAAAEVAAVNARQAARQAAEREQREAADRERERRCAWRRGARGARQRRLGRARLRRRLLGAIATRARRRRRRRRRRRSRQRTRSRRGRGWGAGGAGGRRTRLRHPRGRGAPLGGRGQA